MRWWLIGCSAGVALALGGCGGCSGDGDADGSGGPCADGAGGEGCGELCTRPADCPGGFYCGPGGMCTADCFAEMGTGCDEGERCTASGRCMPALGGDGATFCAQVSVGARRVTPTVIMIVDQSGSMDERFSGAGTRWQVLESSLLSMPDGFIFRLQSIVRFGLALYTSENGGNDATPAFDPCPMLETVDAALDNYGAIEPVYRSADPVEDTPTGDAISAVLDRVLSIPDPGPDPTIFVLATDGEPDRCEQADPQPTPEAQAETIEAVTRAYESGIRTFLIDVGNEVSPAHKQDVANAGIGVGPGDPDAPYWTATDDRGLEDALSTIIGGALSCEIALEGEIQDLAEACTGTVMLNGRTLTCDDPDGWRAVDSTHIELVGEACDELLSSPDAVLEASFPCDVVLI